MKFFIDTEFLEGTQKEKFPISLFRKNTPPTIDIISIGVVSEEGAEYYAISKDFNLKEAWNRFQLKKTSPAKKYIGIFEEREYWIRENVLKPIFYEWKGKDIYFHEIDFTYQEFKKLLNEYGKTNKQIAEEVKNFCGDIDSRLRSFRRGDSFEPEFYAYYGSYDWVAFCWLFGKMIDLPKGFPYLTYDIQQLIVENNIDKKQLLKEVPQINNHNALQDALWNKNAFNWIENEIKYKNNR
jgi:hypothetical protein